nr:pre-mRNA splicing Prp18-interacting factor [Tanacetum cinerariifolium]
MSSFVLCVRYGEPLYGFSPCRWCTCEQCGIDLRDGFCPLCNSRNSCVYDHNPNSFDCPPDSYHPPHPTYETYSGDSCGIDSNLGYDCPPQFPLNYEPEPGYIQNYNSKFNRYSFFETLKVLLLAWDRVFEIKDALGNKQYKLEDTQELFRELSNDVQNIHEELAKYINTLGWNRPAFYDDDDDDDVDYTIAITPVLSTEEPIDSLSMGDKHLDTIPATGSDEVIKSSVENLVPIPSESEGIPEHMCDVPFHDNSPPLDVSKDKFTDFSESNNEFSSIDDDSFSIDNINYAEASPPDSELVSSEAMKIVIPEVGGIDDDILLTIKDDILYEKLLNDNLLIATIEALNDNPTPSSDCKTNGSTTTDSDISLSNYEFFYFNDDHIEEISSGSTTTHSDISLSEYDSFIFDFTHEEFADELAHIISISPPEYDCFYFRNLPDPGELISIFNSKIRKNLSTTCVNLPTEDDHSPLLAYVVWIFLAYLTYPIIPLYLYPFGNEDTIFDPVVQYSWKFKDSCQRILSSKSSFPQLQLGI